MHSPFAFLTYNDNAVGVLGLLSVTHVSMQGRSKSRIDLVGGFIKYRKKLIFIVIKCILTIGKNICQ